MGDKHYGPYAGRDSCQDIQRIEIPDGMSFQNFMKKSAEDRNDGSWGGTVVTINRDWTIFIWYFKIPTIINKIDRNLQPIF